MEVQNYKDLIGYLQDLSKKNKFIKEFKCCDYDVLLGNQSNIKYPCLWADAVPSVRLSEDDLLENFIFTLSMLYQQDADERKRFEQNCKVLSELMEFVARVKDESDALGIDVVGTEYECDFSLSNDKDMRWRVDLKVVISACSQVHAEKWNDL